MSRTIEAIVRHMVPPTKLGPVPAKNRDLTAEWQNGVETIRVYPQRELRLVFVRSLLGAKSSVSL